jgi:phosphomannomutase
LPISALAAELPQYAIWKTKTELDRKLVPAALNELEQHFREATSGRLDGLRLDWQHTDGSGSWLLVRGSNTEPIVRIIAEAPTMGQAQDLCDRAAKVIASV